MATNKSGRHSVAPGAAAAIQKHVAKQGKYGTKTPKTKRVTSGIDAQQRLGGNENGVR